MPRENDLEGAQDRGGKHGGQAGMPRPAPAPSGELRKAQRERTESADDENAGKQR
jgi:hypothetical protein